MVRTTESHSQVLAIIPQQPPTLTYGDHFKVINLSFRNLIWAYRKEFPLVIYLSDKMFFSSILTST